MMLTLKDTQKRFADDLKSTPFDDIRRDKSFIDRGGREHISFMS